MKEGTSEYWRKLLELDVSVPGDFLKRYQTPLRWLRPLFYKLVGLFLKYYCPEKISGLDNIPEKPPYIIAANHGSAMDFVAVAWAMGNRKEELYPLTTKLFYDNPWALFWIKVAANAVRIDTVEEFLPALRVAVKILQAGGAIYIQPEGMRSKVGEILPFRPGVGVLAVETGAPVVPVYLHNTWKVLPTGQIIPRPYPVAVCFGKPIFMDDYRQRLKNTPAYEIYKTLTDDLREAIIKLKETISK